MRTGDRLPRPESGRGGGELSHQGHGKAVLWEAGRGRGDTRKDLSGLGMGEAGEWTRSDTENDFLKAQTGAVFMNVLVSNAEGGWSVGFPVGWGHQSQPLPEPGLPGAPHGSSRSRPGPSARRALRRPPSCVTGHSFFGGQCPPPPPHTHTPESAS